MTKLCEYITTCISSSASDLDHADDLVAIAKDRGWTAASRSDMIRFALRQLTEADIPQATAMGGKLAPHRQP
jgi:hypothetical protein